MASAQLARLVTGRGYEELVKLREKQQRPKAPPQRRVGLPRFKPKAEKTERPNPHGLFSAQYILDRCGPN
jgi:hypothetical protein